MFANPVSILDKVAMLRFSTVVLVAASIYLVDALPGGAPQGACDNLTPSPSAHGTPQANDSPYVIDLTQFDDNNGSFVYVPGRTYTRKILLTIYICMTLCAAPTHLLGRGGERRTDGPNVPVAVRANGRCDGNVCRMEKFRRSALILTTCIQLLMRYVIIDCSIRLARLSGLCGGLHKIARMVITQYSSTVYIGMALVWPAL